MRKNWAVVTDSPDATERVAACLASMLTSGDVLALVGELGAGKTRFVQGLARALGVTGYVRSPSFMLVHRYRGRVPLVHADAFRLSGTEELDEIGFSELCEGAVVAIEWADRVEPALGSSYLRIRFVREHGQDVRRLEFIPRGPRFEAVVEELMRRCE